MQTDRRKGRPGLRDHLALKDTDNYYITRANALEDNVHLYHVVKGKRFDSRDGTARCSPASGTTWRWR